MTTATARLADFIARTSLGDCPDAAIAQTRRAALDTIGVMLAGAAEPVARAVRAVVRADGSVPLCTIVGTSLRASTAWAALANGAAGHAHDFDDTNFALMGHPSAPLLSAALASAEAETADGAAVTLAYIIVMLVVVRPLIVRGMPVFESMRRLDDDRLALVFVALLTSVPVVESAGQRTTERAR